MTPTLPTTLSPKFPTSRPARPMLARVAESMYWMSRYVERAEHVARLVLVNDNVLTDIGEMAPKLQQKLWQGVLQVLYLDHKAQATTVLASRDNLAQRVASYMAFDADNPNSLLSCLTKARENARSIREIISNEMWESLNVLYWGIRAEDARVRFEETAQDLFRQVMTGSFLFQGLSNQTITHGQGWHFIQLAKYLERVDITCRILDTKFEILRAAEKKLDMPLRNIHWMAVLRSCCSIEAYRRMHPGDMDPLAVAAFLILEPHFPRSVAYGVRRAHESIAGIRRTIGAVAAGTAERILGRLDAQLENAEPAEIVTEGVQVYLRQVQERAAAAAAELQKAYFLH